MSESPPSGPAHVPDARAQDWAQLAEQAFEEVVKATPGFVPRAGQRQMAAQVAHTLSHASLANDPADSLSQNAPEHIQRAIAVIQAGTGVGKSLAYSAPAVALAIARGTRVVISTATVALQEQLVNKDLPALAERMPGGFRFALAKGRGRYVCKFKLERLASGGDATESSDNAGEASANDLFADEPAFGPPVAQLSNAERHARIQFYSRMSDVLANNQWDGDRDSLETPPPSDVWQPIAAVSQTCTGRHCPAFGSCVYYDKRKALVNAQVIVANHDLLLSSLGSRLLPELDQALWVFDEAHHLPGTALGQFATRTELNRIAWIDNLASRAQRVGVLLGVDEVVDVSTHAQALTRHLRDLERIVSDLFGQQLADNDSNWGPATVRLALGALPEPMVAPIQQIEQHAEGLTLALQAVSKALRAEMKDKPEEAPRLSTLYAQIGMLTPKLEDLSDTVNSLLHSPEEGAPPMAKWVTLTQPANDDKASPKAAGGKTGKSASGASSGYTPILSLHTSPILPSVSLHHRLWKLLHGAILTSATMTSMDSFDFFLRDAGLSQDTAVRTLAVPSPFDFPKQGELIAASTHADPRHANAFNTEMCSQLMQDLQSVQAGALVLFTSRAQLNQAVAALTPVLRARTLVQTELPRHQLLKTHRETVAKGQPSIIFGMQSFGEGLDLPGDLCESLFITKLPFSPPNEPVGEARAEWLRSLNRDPFMELVVPATAIRLAQWMGRAIRTESDLARVYCYDKRLTGTRYGQMLLKGVPPFRLTPRAPL